MNENDVTRGPRLTKRNRPQNYHYRRHRFNRTRVTREQQEFRDTAERELQAKQINVSQIQRQLKPINVRWSTACILNNTREQERLGKKLTQLEKELVQAQAEERQAQTELAQATPQQVLAASTTNNRGSNTLRIDDSQAQVFRKHEHPPQADRTTGDAHTLARHSFGSSFAPPDDQPFVTSYQSVPTYADSHLYSDNEDDRALGGAPMPAAPSTQTRVSGDSVYSHSNFPVYTSLDRTFDSTERDRRTLVSTTPAPQYITAGGTLEDAPTPVLRTQVSRDSRYNRHMRSRQSSPGTWDILSPESDPTRPSCIPSFLH